MKKKRILLVNNGTTAMFMKMKLHELGFNNQDNCETIVFFENQIFKKKNWTNFNKENSQHKKRCFFFLKDYKIYELPEISYDELKLKSILIDFFKFFSLRRSNIKKIKKILYQLKIKNDCKIEIWYSNNLWQYYLKKIFQNANYILFDHGVTESINALEQLEKKSLTKKIKDFFKKIITCIFITTPFQIHDKHCTLVYKELKKIIKKDIFLSLKPEYMQKSIIKNFNLKIPFFKKKIALLLIDNIKLFSNKKKDSFNFFKNVEYMFLSNILPLLKKNKVEAIVIKAHPWAEDYFHEYFKNKSIIKNINTYFLSNYCINLPVEYFLFFNNIKFLIGPLSSSNIFAKKINKKIKNISYHHWYSKFLINNYGSSNYTSKELENTERIFFNKYKNKFKFVSCLLI